MQALIYIVEDDMNIQEIEMFALKNTGDRLLTNVPALFVMIVSFPPKNGK